MHGVYVRKPSARTVDNVTTVVDVIAEHLSPNATVSLPAQRFDEIVAHFREAGYITPERAIEVGSSREIVVRGVMIKGGDYGD